MKLLLAMAVLLSSVGALAADTIVGTSTLTIYPDFGSVSAFDVNDIGTGLTSPEYATSLVKVVGGYKGFFINNHYWDVTCDAKGCQGNGPTELDLKLTAVAGGYKLDGLVDYYPVTLTLTDAKVDVSVEDPSNTGFSLVRQANGSYAGEGSTTFGDRIQTLQLTFATTGTLSGALKDPATALMLLVTPFIQ